MILDELVVVLGLDASKFTEEQRRALEDFRRTRFEADRLGTSVEASSEKASASLGLVRKGVMGLVGALAGAEAAAFIDHVVRMDAATGRLARSIGTSVENLGIWQGMIRQVGGTAEEATAALSAMQDQINNVRQGNGMFDDKTAFLLTKIGGLGGRNADQVFRDLQKYFAGEVGAGRMTADTAATEMRWLPGMNQSMINLLLSDFKKVEEAARAVGGATKETADAAASLQGKLSLVAQAMERFTASLLPILEYLGFRPVGEIARDAKSVGAKGFLDRLDAAAGSQDTIAKPFADWLSNKIWGSGGASAGGGGTRGDRNNNPGNMKDGPFARAHGATGADSGGFAVFPDRATGSAAQEALVRGGSYQGLTLEQFAQRYAEGSPAWRNTVGGALGIGPGDVVNNQDPRLIDAIRRAEGTGARGAAASRGANNSRTSTSTSETHVSIGQVVLPGVTDAEGFSHGLGDTMRRWGITSPANSGLA